MNSIQLDGPGLCHLATPGSASLRLDDPVADTAQPCPWREALPERQAFMQSVLSGIAVEIVVLDREGVILAVNDAWRYFAMENAIEAGQALRGSNVGDSYFAAFQANLDDSARAARDGILAVIDARLPAFTLEYPCHSRDMQRWFIMNVCPLGAALPGGVVITHADISERKQVEGKLHLAASVFSHAREGIMLAGADGNIIDVNAAFTQITGYGREEVLGRNPHLLSSGRQGKQFYAALWAALAKNGRWSGEIWNRRKKVTEKFKK